MFLLIKFWNWTNTALMRQLYEKTVEETAPIVTKLGVREMHVKCLFPLQEHPSFGYARHAHGIESSEDEVVIEIVLSCKEDAYTPAVGKQLTDVINDIARSYFKRSDRIITNSFFMFIPCL